MIYPLMPDHASKLYSQIGLSGIENEKWDNAGDFTIKPGQKIGNIEPLFKKLDLPIEDEFKLQEEIHRKLEEIRKKVEKNRPELLR